MSGSSPCFLARYIASGSNLRVISAKTTAIQVMGHPSPGRSAGRVPWDATYRAQTDVILISLFWRI
ncbi:protein of unknown function [Pararobbsia alpina]